jgi:hypothetical protein
MKILISPFPAKPRNQPVSAKHYPYWEELVSLLKANGHEIIQIGVKGEPRIDGADQFIIGWPFDKLKQLMESCDTWIAIDSFWPHFCHYHRLKNGVVLWGKSDYRIWGYPENENLFVSEKNFREFQYCDWHDEPHDPSVFVPARQVVWAVERILNGRTQAAESANRPTAIRDGVSLAVT